MPTHHSPRADTAPVLTDKQREIVQRHVSIIKLVDEGKLLSDLVSILGIKESTLRSDLYALGIDTSVVSNKAPLRAREADVKRLHGEGLSAQSIALELGMTANQVSYILENKLKLPEVPAADRKLSATETEHVQGMIGLVLMGDIDVVSEVHIEFSMSAVQAKRLLKIARKTIAEDAAGNGEIIGPHILELSLSGRTIEQVTAAADVPLKDIRRIATSVGVEKIWLISEKRAQRVAQTADLYLSGLSRKEIAAQFRVSVESVRRDLTSIGISSRSAYQAEQVKHLVEAGVSVPDIATELNCSESKVRKIVQAHEEIKLPPRVWQYMTHGTVQCYQAGCDCGPCKAANSRRQRQYQKRVREMKAARLAS